MSCAPFLKTSSNQEHVAFSSVSLVYLTPEELHLFLLNDLDFFHDTVNTMKTNWICFLT